MHCVEQQKGATKESGNPLLPVSDGFSFPLASLACSVCTSNAVSACLIVLVRTSRPSGILLAKENPMMIERQKEAWSAVLLTALVVGMILGAWLVLRLTTT